MLIDLTKDAQAVRDFLNGHVGRHASGKAPPPVGRIVLGFQFGDDGWVTLYFDTRAKPRPDGKWRGSIEQRMLPLPHWSESFDRLADDEEPLEFIQSDGTRTTAARSIDELDQNAVAALFGEMLRGVLLAARDDGTLRDLPKSPGCALQVEELEEDGYVWPRPGDEADATVA